MNIEMTAKNPFKGPRGDRGPAGLGIQSWEVRGHGIRIVLTDGREIIFEDLRGPKGDNGRAPAIEDIAQVVLNAIKLPKDGKNGADGISPDPEKIIAEVLKRIEIPTPKDGIDGKDGSDGKDGKDAPFSTWVKNYDVQGSTNIENPSNVIFKIDFDQDTAYGVTAKIIARGPSKLNFFYAEKHGLFYKDPKGSVVRADSDVAVFSPRRSNPALNFEIQSTLTGIQVIAFGLEDEEISWKGELSIAST